MISCQSSFLAAVIHLLHFSILTHETGTGALRTKQLSRPAPKWPSSNNIPKVFGITNHRCCKKTRTQINGNIARHLRLLLKSF